MTITMIFGSMVAGATSEGGGAVAFPVMTLALQIKPAVARDFSLMTQSCGKWIDEYKQRYKIGIKLFYED